MPPPAGVGSAAHLVDSRSAQVLDALGPTIQVLTPARGADRDPCVLRWTIPPRVAVPLHSHPDPETFLPLSGQLEGLVEAPEGFCWISIVPGDVFDVPPNAKHAFRNRSHNPAVAYVATTGRMARFFQESGAPLGRRDESAWPPAEKMLRRFAGAARRYGYWMATRQQNAEVGVRLG
jgi:quercetin dioxygenase-like cupin family protein